MSKLKNDESGFGALEIILIIVIVVLLGLVGWLVYKNHNKKTTATTTATTTTTTSPSALQPTTLGNGQCQASGFPDGSTYAQIAISNTTCTTAASVSEGAPTAKGASYKADGFTCTAKSEGAGSEWASAWGGTYYDYSCSNGNAQVAFNWGTNYTYGN